MDEAQMPLCSVKVADTEATHCTIPFLFQFGKGNPVRTEDTSGAGMEGGADHKGAQENVLG